MLKQTDSFVTSVGWLRLAAESKDGHAPEQMIETLVQLAVRLRLPPYVACRWVDRRRVGTWGLAIVDCKSNALGK